MSENKIISSIYQKIEAQQAKGLKKYGKEVHTDSHSLREWLQHALEETLDKAVYLEAAIQKIDEAEKGTNKRVMKYYEVHDPYYALISAEDEVKAGKVYAKMFDIENFHGNPKEVDREIALIRYGNAVQNVPGMNVIKTMKKFEERKNDILLVDGSLL
ncbi:hypothetical protein [Bacillus subtilis]|uniref:hypothetical protein n=1 Tax=Bacillus subtilis TaxID=1423 RepID=UPI0005ADDEA0|nr:hypothetical protein [Bacillus subtilis]KIN42409.1 hypothetical protein B4070_4281 [Bacillus subtilis]